MADNMADIAAAFHQTAGALDPALAPCLDFLNDMPFFRAYKEHTWDSLHISDGAEILDVACGVGFDVISMAGRFPRSRFVGVDVSAGFLNIARERARGLRNAAFQIGDAAALPFPDNRFDGMRIDRSLQHIRSPLAVIEEMTRVTRPGGRIVLAEPDWGTWIVYNGASEAGNAIAEKWKASFVNPYIGRELAQLLVLAGVTDVASRASALTIGAWEDANVVFDLRRVVENCVGSGIFSAADGEKWLADAEAASRKGSFFSCLTIVESCGTVRK